MARDHPSFNFEVPFYMSITCLIVYVKSCEMSHAHYKTKQNVMQNAKGCHVKVEKPSEM
jgi:hypothetical protein